MTARPNILLIYSDQQRHDTIAALGNPVIRTPHLDGLARGGVAFTHATTPSPVCMAARWSLHSGQWTSTHRCYSNHHPGQRPAFSLPGLLRDVGYVTGLAGKNHSFLTADDVDFYRDNPKPAGAAWEQRRAWQRAHLAVHPRLAEEPAPGGPEADGERAVTDAGIEFMSHAIGDGAAGRAPFFLWLSYTHPHTPYVAPEPYFSMYHDVALPPPVPGPLALNKPFRQHFHQANNDAILPFMPRQTALMRQVYYGMVSQLDAEIGRVLEFLDRLRQLDNTFVVFTSDHGDYMGDYSLYTKSPAMYDCLTRVPLIMRGPGVLPRTDARFASHVDLLPTFAAAAGAACPAEVEGINLLPFLSDDLTTPFRTAAFSEYGVPGEPYTPDRLRAEGLAAGQFANPGNDRLPWEGNPVSLAGRIRMVRTHRWKLVHEPGGTDELYDLERDPLEINNLAAEPDAAADREALMAELARVASGAREPLERSGKP